MLRDGDDEDAADADYSLERLALGAVDGFPGLIGYWDKNLHNRLANQGYRQLLDRDPGSIQGWHMREVLSEELYAISLRQVEAVLRGEPQQFDRDVVDADGRQQHLQFSYVPDVRDDEVAGFWVMGTDISTRVEAERRKEQSVQHYRTLARSMPRGWVLLFDADLRILVAEGDELSTFGFRRETVEGELIDDAFPQALHEEVAPRYRAALSGQRSTWLRRIGRRTFQLVAGPAAGTEGASATGAVVCTDITEQRRDQQMWQALHRIATEVARSATPGEICQQIAEQLLEVFMVDNAAVIRIIGPGDGEVVGVAPGHGIEVGEEMRFGPRDPTALARVLATGEPSWSTYDPDEPDLSANPRLVHLGLQVGAAAPIRSRGQLWGAVGMASRSPRGIDRAMVGRLLAFADLAELAVGHTEAWNALAEEANTDALTGLANRRSFVRQMQQQLAQSLRLGLPLSVAVLDIDHFKEVNDRFGHPAGDRVLAELGRRLTAASREGELVARLGGEEFGWILPATDATNATTAVERLRRAVAAERFDPAGIISLSAGLATFDFEMTPEQLLGAADAALYLAKGEGRDRVRRWVPTRPRPDPDAGGPG